MESLALRRFIENYISITDSEWKVVEAKLVPRTFHSGEIILHEGQICRHLYFLESGLLRYYIFNDGEEVTKFFTEAPYLFTSQVSFTKVSASLENIQAIEQSSVLELTYQDAHDLLTIPAWATFIRSVIQEVQFYTEELLVAMQTYNAEERYNRLLKTNPDLFQRVPLKYIASYLGIAPQSLSRIRKELGRRDRN